MKRSSPPILSLVAALALLAHPAPPDRDQRLAVGTFDSRAVAIAYAHTDAFAEKLRAMRADLDDARASGDAERVRELEEAGPRLQARLHAQGFGTAPVEDLLDLVRGQLPAVAERAGLDVLVSEWALTWRREGAQPLDVTDAVVALFEPDEDTLRTIAELREHPPVPAEQLVEHEH